MWKRSIFSVINFIYLLVKLKSSACCKVKLKRHSDATLKLCNPLYNVQMEEYSVLTKKNNNKKQSKQQKLCVKKKSWKGQSSSSKHFVTQLKGLLDLCVKITSPRENSVGGMESDVAIRRRQDRCSQVSFIQRRALWRSIESGKGRKGD